MSEGAGRIAGDQHILPLRVYYEDTDAAGIVYYANYLKFFERGRTEMLRLVGVDQSRLRGDTGLAFAVRLCTVEYFVPARLDDVLEVRSRLSDLKGASLVAEQAVYRGAELLAAAEVRVACFDTQSGRAARMPPEVRQALAPYHANNSDEAAR